ncbi:MAG TPA: AAA family ATPase [Planctomycetaceae bacterium]|nr:AAA family ATPase [Planctomycetaceae bacterium]
MYESFYGLERRPFSATPDPECSVPVPATDAALAEIRATLESGQGIAVLTAPPGTGKTLVCLRLAAMLADRFACVWLPTASYCTRRSLLQAILYELGRPYAQMAEQELRLQLVSTARTYAGRERAVVVIVDEAHLLSPRLLEELRSLTNIAAAGRSLIRVVLCGQLALEETLAEPALSALNQRIDCQVTLVPLTAMESRDYLAARLRWAGGEPEAIFAPEAVDLICRASDGNPRCLNQLADHALSLGQSRQELPVSAATVRAALDELKQLPLHWADSTAAPESGGYDAADHGADRGDDRGEPSSPCSIEIGPAAGQPAHGRDGWMDDERENAAVIEIGDIEIREPVRAVGAGAAAAAVAGSGAVRGADGFVEVPVIDRYAMLDAGLVPAPGATAGDSRVQKAVQRGDTLDNLVFSRESVPLLCEAFEACEPRVEQTLDELVPLLAAATDSTCSTCDLDSPPQLVHSPEWPRLDVYSTGGQLETEIGSLMRDTCRETGQSLRVVGDEFDIVQPDDEGEAGRLDALLALPASPPTARERIEREDAPDALRPPRHYAQLFSELRRRQRQRM